MSSSRFGRAVGCGVRFTALGFALGAAIGCAGRGGASVDRPVLGRLAPAMSLQDCAGRQHTLAELRGKFSVLTFVCGCPQCRRLIRAWSSLYGHRGDVFLVAVTGLSAADAGDLTKEEGIDFPVLLDASRVVSKRWHSTSCPRCWVIDSVGRLRYGSPEGGSVLQIVSEVRRHVIVGRISHVDP